MLLPVGSHRLHGAVGCHIGNTHIKGALVAFCGIPMQGNVAVCQVICQHSTGHVVQLDIITLADHQYIITAGQKLIF